MDMQSKFPKFRSIIVAIIILTAGLGCKFLSGSSASTVPTDATTPANQPNSPAETQPNIPDGWKVNKDSTGACQVATPAGWQLGVDFFLGVDKADPGPMEGAPGQYPPTGLSLWGTDDATQLPEGHYYQIRASRVDDGKVCSVWRIKADVDFADEEKEFLEQVSETLQAVQ
jgi:hypothetical protein